MKRTLAIICALAFVGLAFVISTPVVAADNGCDPKQMDNAGCCDREPINPACCTDPTETHYQYDDGTYACLDCEPDPRAPQCCEEHETWWQYPDNTHDCLPFFVVMLQPQYADAHTGENVQGECANDAWADELVAWVATDGAETRPECLNESADSPAGSVDVYYDLRYGAYGITAEPTSPGGPSTQADADRLAISGYSGVGTDCRDCPPPWLTEADCLLYYDGACYSVEVAQASTFSRLLP